MAPARARRVPSATRSQNRGKASRLTCQSEPEEDLRAPRGGRKPAQTRRIRQ